MDSTENEIQKYHITDRIIISMDKKINKKKSNNTPTPFMPEAETINLLCLVVIRQGLLMQNKFPKIRDTPEAGGLKVDYMQQCNMSPSFPLLIQSCPNYKNPR